jgi:hypothetical protein
MTNGAVNLDSGEKYYLTYEIRKYNVQIPLVEATSNKIKSVIYKQHFRKWCFVTSDELNGIKICELRDKNGTFLISNTEYYVPMWLREIVVMDDIPHDEMELPVADANE